jgi:hypothetical protein
MYKNAKAFFYVFCIYEMCFIGIGTVSVNVCLRIRLNLDLVRPQSIGDSDLEVYFDGIFVCACTKTMLL